MSDPDPDTRTIAYAAPADANGQTVTFGAATTTDAGPPAEVAGYSITRELGRGGMGVVYLAVQSALGREVALKMVLAGEHASATDRARFLAEAEAVAAVQHPGIVQVYECGTADGRPYFALEYCPGGSLAAKLAGTPLPPREAAELAARLARAVQAAHEKGIVHRDLKPANVLLAADGTPKVTDFGLARRGPDGSGLTATGAVMGSPSYMAPEQAAGTPDAVSPRTDVYALGAVLYECLTGRPPFRAATALETILQVTRDDPVPPTRLQPRLPRDLETVCLKCLQRDPARRYESAAALADDLGRFLRGQPITARPVPAWERGWKWAKRRPAAAAGLAVVVAAVAAVFAVVATKNAELKQERDAARLAEAEADTQRAKAQARLQAAVAMTDRMISRVDGDEWLTKPELADERREILEDAVAFYRSFTGDDGNDPLVRREKARALFRIGSVHLQTGENETSRVALAEAAAVQRALAADFPDDPDHKHDLARTEMYRGHVINLTTDFTRGPSTDGLDAYLTGAKLAREAADARPGRDDYRITQAECLLSAGQFHSFASPSEAARYFAEAKAVIEPIAARPGAAADAHVVLVQATLNAAAADTRQGRPVSWPEVVERTEKLLGKIDPKAFRDARSRAQHAQARTTVRLQRGGLLAQDAGKREEALRVVREAVAEFDRQLASTPKMFPARQAKLNALVQEADLLARMGRTAEAKGKYEEVFRFADQIAADAPHMGWIKTNVVRQRASHLVLRARDGDTAGLNATAGELLAAARPDHKPAVQYDLACAYALASRHGSAGEKEDRAAKAVQLLAGLFDGPFFRNPRNVAHLGADADLDPLRERADFRALLAKAKAVPPRK